MVVQGWRGASHGVRDGEDDGGTGRSQHRTKQSPRMKSPQVSKPDVMHDVDRWRSYEKRIDTPIRKIIQSLEHI